jgi:23S rRNA (uridine2552-2'-O)-methyltransferase
MIVARSKQSRRWLDEHRRDGFVRQAQAAGYRSRAVFKLQALDRKFALFDGVRVVVDLGAAPGAWAQYAAERVGPRGRVVVVDLLPMEPLPGVTVIRGDLADPATEARIKAALGTVQADLVLADMAPNLTGNKAMDQPRSIGLCEAALETAQAVLRPGGDLVMKAFQGEGLDDLRRTLAGVFGRTSLVKPPASRSRSAEVYLVARNFNLV